MTAGTTLISVEEYLASSHKPAYEYADGVLRQKAMPTYQHGRMELRVSILINRLELGFDAVPEQTVKISDRRYLVPDVAVQRLSDLQQPYPSKPSYLCIEILSPQDRFSDTLAKCEEYHAWGVPSCWIIDPENQQCWEYHAGTRPNQIAAEGIIRAQEIALDVKSLFSAATP